MLCKHRLCLVLEHFHYSKKETLSPLQSLPMPSPHQSAFCLWICLFWTFYKNGIIQHMAFRVWRFSLSIFSSVTPRVGVPLLFVAEWGSVVWMDHVLFVPHWTFEWFLLFGSCECRWCVHVCTRICLSPCFQFLGVCTWEWNYWVTLSLCVQVFEELPDRFPEQPHHFVLSLATPLHHRHMACSSLFYTLYPSWLMGSGISLWFWFTFPWWLVTLNIFSCNYWPFVYLLWGNVHSSPLPLF